MLHIVFKRDSLAFLHQIRSNYHNTFANYVPLPDEALCQIWCKSVAL